MSLILVCGGREFNNWRLVHAVLDSALKKFANIRLMIGGAKGADQLADNWAKSREVECLRIPARWSIYGKAAGPIRNKTMLDEKPDLVIAFPGGPGTQHMIRVAKDAGIQVVEVRR